jgi:hypothetical protein
VWYFAFFRLGLTGCGNKFPLITEPRGQRKPKWRPRQREIPIFPSVKNRSTPSNLLSPNSKITFLDIVTKTVAGAAILKTIKFTLMYNTFRLLGIKDDDMNKSSARVHFH